MSRPPPHAPLPTYDWDNRDGNVFPWLIQNAKQVRAQRKQAVMLHAEIQRNEFQRSNRAIEGSE